MSTFNDERIPEFMGATEQRYVLCEQVLESGSEDWLAARKLKLRPELMTEGARIAAQNCPRNEKGNPIVLGGSDLGAALGLSPYKTNHRVWMELQEREKPADLSNNPAVKRGTMAEEFVGDLLLEDLRGEFGAENVPFIGREKHSFGLIDEPWFVVNTDAWLEINGDHELAGKWLVEIKTLSHRAYDTQDAWRDGIVPKHYEMQCRLYNHVFPEFRGVIICCAWGLDDDTRAHVFIPRDEILESQICAAARDFVYSIAYRQEPETIHVTEGRFDIPSDLADEFRALVDEYQAAELARTSVKEQLKVLVKDNDELFDCGDKGYYVEHVTSPRPEPDAPDYEWDDKIYFSRKLKNERPSYYISVKHGKEKSFGVSI